MRYPFVLAALLALAVPAQADEQSDHRMSVAQMAFLAQLAPKVCADFKTDDEAVAAYMAGSQLNERDLIERYGSATRPVADAFQASVERDQQAACNQVWERLGDDGLGLVIENDRGGEEPGGPDGR